MKRMVGVFDRHAVAPWCASDGFNVGQEVFEGVAKLLDLIGFSHRHLLQAMVRYVRSVASSGFSEVTVMPFFFSPARKPLIV